jgi:hypothetical protein
MDDITASGIRDELALIRSQLGQLTQAIGGLTDQVAKANGEGAVDRKLRRDEHFDQH